MAPISRLSSRFGVGGLPLLRAHRLQLLVVLAQLVERRLGDGAVAGERQQQDRRQQAAQRAMRIGLPISREAPIGP